MTDIEPVDEFDEHVDAPDDAALEEAQPASGRSPRWRLARRIFAGVAAVLVVYYLATLWLVYRTGNTDRGHSERSLSRPAHVGLLQPPRVDRPRRAAAPLHCQSRCGRNC